MLDCTKPNSTLTLLHGTKHHLTPRLYHARYPAGKSNGPFRPTGFPLSVPLVSLGRLPTLMRSVKAVLYPLGRVRRTAVPLSQALTFTHPNLPRNGYRTLLGRPSSSRGELYVSPPRPNRRYCLGPGLLLRERRV